MPVDEFEDICGIVGLRDEGDFETVAGFIIHRLGRLPRTGDRVERDDMAARGRRHGRAADRQGAGDTVGGSTAEASTETA